MHLPNFWKFWRSVGKSWNVKMSQKFETFESKNCPLRPIILHMIQLLELFKTSQAGQYCSTNTEFHGKVPSWEVGKISCVVYCMVLYHIILPTSPVLIHVFNNEPLRPFYWVPTCQVELGTQVFLRLPNEHQNHQMSSIAQIGEYATKEYCNSTLQSHTLQCTTLL